jgi:hypothetical protein
MTAPPITLGEDSSGAMRDGAQNDPDRPRCRGQTASGGGVLGRRPPSERFARGEAAGKVSRHAARAVSGRGGGPVLCEGELADERLELLGGLREFLCAGGDLLG